MKWDDNLVLEGDTDTLKERAQFQLAMYALHLSSGNSICCRRIKADTIAQYVFAAASFLAMFSGVDYRKDSPTDSHMGHILAPVYRDLKKFEGIPDRREPYDLKMHLLARREAATHPVDSLIPALTDGFEQGLAAGYRLSEWAQPSGRTNPGNPQLNHLIRAAIRTRALVPDDFRCETYSGKRLVGLDILTVPLSAIANLWVVFRTQKNGDHGEEKLCARNPAPGGICFVSSVYRSMQRFRRLTAIDGRLDPAKTPLSVYLDPATLRVRLIASPDIECHMRALAATVYQLHPIKDAKDLRRWGTHSLRVGACVVLHAMGFSALDIQWILRWRSLAFMAYLRNVAITSTRQYLALDRAAAMPHLV